MKQIITQAIAIIPMFLLHGTVFYVGLFIYLIFTANVVTNTSKTRTLETRLNSHVVATAPAVNFVANGGTVGGAVTVNGNHTVFGQVNAFSAGVSGTVTSNAVTTNSATVFGNVSASGTASSNVVSTNGISNFGDTHTSGTNYSGAYEGSSIHVSGNSQADGSISAGNFSGNYFGNQGGVSTVGGAPGTYSSSYETSLASAINGIINRLNSSGLI
jgi:hypothetical protein